MSRIITVDAHSTFWRQLYGASHQTASTQAGTGSHRLLRAAGRDDMDDSPNKGYQMLRSGSIVGISLFLNCTAHTETANSRVFAYINNVEAGLIATVSVTATGLWTAVATQAAGIDTFSAGDILHMESHNGGTIDGGVTGMNGCLVEVEFDEGKVQMLNEEGYQRTSQFTSGGGI